MLQDFSNKCQECKAQTLCTAENVNIPEAELTKEFDKSGRLYPSEVLFKFVETLEEVFMFCFSFGELHRQHFEPP